MAHVAEWKTRKVEELTSTIARSPVIGIVDVHGIPAKQLSRMRDTLRGSVSLHVTKATLLRLAFENVVEDRPGIEGLKEVLEGQVALVVTEENPFKLFRLMEQTKTRSPARGGEVATEDITVPAGDTEFKPGPLVREFQKVGIPAAIERGRVVIKKNATLVKEGEVIPKDLATVLPRLDILPLLVGLDLKAAFEDGTVYDPDVLDVDMDGILGDMARGAQAAFGLAINIHYTSPLTVRPLIAKAHQQALSLAVEAGIVNAETAPIVLARAQARAMALASRVPDALDDDLREALEGAAAAPVEAPAPDGEADGKGKGEDEGDGKDEEEEKVSEEDAAAGLSSLFG